MSPSSLTVQIVRDSATTVLRLGVSYLLIRWDDELRKYDYNYLIVTQVDYAQPITSGDYNFTYPLDHPIIHNVGSNSHCLLTGFSLISKSGLSSLSLYINSGVNGESTLLIDGQFSPSNGDGVLVKLSFVVVTHNYFAGY
jgi:hypothetical protein